MKNNQNILHKAGIICFYLAVMIEVIMVIIDKSAYTNPIEGQLFRVTFVLCALKVISTKYSLKEWIIFGAFLLLGVISYLATGRNEIIRFVTFAMAFKGIEIKPCLKLVFGMTVTGLALIILLACGGIYGDMALTMDYGRGAVETRYTLGMGHPNALQCMVWAVMVLGMYVYFDKMKWYFYLVLAALQTATFLLTDSKTAFLVGMLTIAMAFCIQYCVKLRDKKITKWLGLAAMGGSMGISVLSAAEAYRLYNYVWKGDRTPITMIFWYLDKALNGRIYALIDSENWEGAMNTWRLFSTPDSTYYFDMGWARLFYWYGIIPGIIFCVLVIALLLYCWKQKDYMAVVCMISFAIYSVIEAHAVSVYLARNYVLFLMAYYGWKFLEGYQNRVPINKEKSA